MTSTSRALLPLLMMLITLSYLSSGIYLPAMPLVEQFFHTTGDLTKLTQASYLLGLGLSQLMYGPLSDAYGRRVPLLIGLTFLLIGAGFCASAESIYQLIVARLIQGFGAGGGVSLTRAILRDRFMGKDLARIASYFTINAFIFASSAPLIGSLVLHVWGWQWIFTGLTIVSFVALIICAKAIPETNRHIDATSIYPKTLATNIVRLFSDRVFLIYSALTFFAFCSLMGWITLSAMVIQKHYGYTPIQYGIIMFAVGVVNAIGGFINSRLTARIALPTLIQRGLMIALLSAAILIITNLIGFTPIVVILAAITLYTFGFTFIFANAFALAFSQFEKSTGLASAGFAFLQALGGVTGSVLMSYSPDNTTLAYATMLLVCCVISIAVVRLSPAELNTM